MAEKKSRPDDLPPLKSLVGFEAAARLQSVRAAAEELNLTHPAISHQIRSLETYIGASLFHRDGRNIVLNEVGRSYYDSIRLCLMQLSEAKNVALSQLQDKPLNVQSYITFSVKWLASRMRRFHDLHPNIELHLLTSGDSWEFDPSQAEIGVIYKNRPLADRYCWIPLFRSYVFPVCRPELVSGSQLTVQDVAKMPLLIVESEKSYWTWEQWFDSAGCAPQYRKGNIHVDTLVMALEMAQNGEGVALVNGPMVDHDLETGRLICPVDHIMNGKGEWGMVFDKRYQDDARIQAFCRFLLGEASGYSPLISG